ncbi:MAG TPA: anti-sigma regulatory factor [Labilithrix sp.]
MSADALEAAVAVERERDIVVARQKGRELAAAAGFLGTEQTLIATAISEVARNILTYAERGEVILRVLDEGGRRGILVVARDEGPGIADVALAMRDGYSTAKSLGMGLPGARRLMDELEVDSALGKGTTVTMKKWVR